MRSFFRALNNPKPTICKFIRQIAGQKVTSHHRVITEVDLKGIGFNDGDLRPSKLPKTQELLSEAKKFNARFSYPY